MKKLAMFVVLSMLCCFYAATSLAAQTNYWKFHIVADERVDGNSICLSWHIYYGNKYMR